MRGITFHPHVSHLDVEQFAWLLPVVILVLLVAGAIGGLLAGLAAPETIGADGLASTVIGAP